MLNEQISSIIQMIDVSAIYSSYSQQIPGINKTDIRKDLVFKQNNPGDNNNNLTPTIPTSINKTIISSPSQPNQDNPLAGSTSENEVSQKERRAIEDLKTTDRAVRAHESAHQSAGGGLVRGGASYTYVIGPDGKRYAVGGEVQIDISVDPDNPEATIRKMQQVRRAALAPADPSAQDRSVAAIASAIEANATAIVFRQRSNFSSSKKTKFISAYINPSPQIALKGLSVNVLVGSVATGK